MKRTGLAHKPCATAKALRPKTCAKAKGGCGENFTPARSMQKACSPRCAEAMAGNKREREAIRAALEDRRKTKAQLEAMKTKPKLSAEVEKAMNKYVRLRDFAAGCISCGRQFNAGAIGGACDAGHYRSKGSALHLRFDPRNLHAQCKHCNDALASNPIGYERGLRLKIGDEAVDALKVDEEPRKHTRDELRALRDEYRAKARAVAGAAAD